MRAAKNVLLVCCLFTGLHTTLDALTTCGPATVSAPSGGASQAQIESDVCDKINQKFQTGNISSVLSYMAKAYATASVGGVADYATNMQVFSLGVSTTVGMNNITPPLSASDVSALQNRLSATTVPDFGAGAAFNATLGVSFRHLNFKRRGWFDPKNINLYASLMIVPTITYQLYSLSATSGSFYFQYKLLPMRELPLGLLTWGGLDIGLGYTYTTTKATISSSDKLTSISFTTNGQDVLYEPAGNIALNFTSHVIPLEVSTNFSLLYFLSLVVGAAADFHILSQADISANVSGSVKVGGVSTANDYANFSLSDSARQSNVLFRTFFGPQFSVWKIRVYVLAHITSDQSYGATVGARFSW